jgi:hypothetical protein
LLIFAFFVKKYDFSKNRPLPIVFHVNTSVSQMALPSITVVLMSIYLTPATVDGPALCVWESASEMVVDWNKDFFGRDY